MSYRSLARTWRPQTFAEVIGQEPVVRTLTHAVEAGRIAQAYLFSGQRGVGKTSLARILAKALNCAVGPTPAPCGRCGPCQAIASGASLDILEIDAASHSKVEEMRELLETVQYLSLGGRYKVYIIDEVHRLSSNAFDALLKTLEEPPPQTCFILATTELHKVPDTIYSRCQHFAFARVPPRLVQSRLAEIANTEGVHVTERGVMALARAADGSLRDALNLLEQARAFCGSEIADTQLLQMLGATDPDWLRALTTAIVRREPAEVLRLIRQAVDRGDEPHALLADLVEEINHLTVAKLATAPEEFLLRQKDDLESLRTLAREVAVEDLHRLFTLLTHAQDQLKNALQPTLFVEMVLLKAVHLATLQPLERLLDRVLALEGRLAGPPPPTPPQPQQLENPRPAHSRPAAFPPPQEPPHPTPTPRPTPGTIERGAERPGTLSSGTNEMWQEVVKRVKARKAPLGVSLEAAHPTVGTDEVLINFGAEGGHRIGLVEREDNLTIVREALAQVIGRPIRLRLVATGLPGQAVLVNDAIKIFEGRVVEPSPKPQPKSRGPNDAPTRLR